MNELYETGLGFVSRFSERNTVIYYEVMLRCCKSLRRSESLVKNNGRSFNIENTGVKTDNQKWYEVTGDLGFDPAE